MKLRRCIAFGLVLALLLTGLPIDMLDGILVVEATGVADESDFEIDESGCITRYVGDGGDVVIPDTINGIKVTKIGDKAFAYCEDVTNVVIPEGVTCIGKEAFYVCWKMVNVDIPETITTIDEKAFWYCSGLTSMVLPKGIISIEEGTFTGCRELTSVVIPESVTSIGSYAFSCCSSLTSISLPPNLKSIEDGILNECSSITSIELPENITMIGEHAFSGCKKLASINLPKGITTIGSRAFSGCSSLTTIDLPDKLMTMGYGAFSYCDKLTSVVLPGSLVDMGYAFVNCSGLKSIKVSKGITKIEKSTFANCSKLMSVDLPEGVVEIGDSAFSGCSELTDINLPEGITSIGYKAFCDCKKITNITLPKSLKEIEEAAFYGCSGIKSIDIPEGITVIAGCTFYNCSGMETIKLPNTLKTIAFEAFRGCSGLMNIDIPKNVTSIQKGAFRDCSGLVNLVIPEGITTIPEYTFYGCSGLTNVKLPESLKLINDEAFNNCSELVEIDIPDRVSKIEFAAFCGCSGLKSIELPKCLTYMGFCVFEGCSSLTSITIPEGITQIPDMTFYRCKSLKNVNLPTRTTQIGQSAFSNCESLTSIDLPNGLTQISESAFSNCESLSSISLPNGLTQISERAFSGCKSLTSIEIPKGLTEIEEGVFSYCSSLNNIVIPEGINKIGDKAFFKCDSLTSITISESVKEIGNYAFSECANLKEIVIPEGTTSIGANIFSECSSLTSITIPNQITEISEYAFYECKSLANVRISNGVTIIGDYAFAKCNSLKSIDLPEGVTTIGKSTFYDCDNLKTVTLSEGLTTIGDSAFESCYNLVNITLPEGVTSIGKMAFSVCSNLTNITLPESIVSIGEFAFSYCDSLTSIELPESITCIGGSAFLYCKSLTSIELPKKVALIESNTFSHCESLTSVVIQNGVTTIEYEAFSCCNSLASIIIPESVTTIDDEAFRGCPDDLTIYGVSGSYAQEYAQEHNILFEVLFESDVECTTTNIEGTAGDICEVVLQPKAQTATVKEKFPNVGAIYVTYRASSSDSSIYSVERFAQYDKSTGKYRFKGVCKKPGMCTVRITNSKGKLLSMVPVVVKARDINKKITASNDVFGVVVSSADSARLKGMKVIINGEKATTDSSGYAEFKQDILKAQNTITISGGKYSTYYDTFYDDAVLNERTPILAYTMGVTDVLLKKSGSTKEINVINSKVTITGEQTFSLTCKDDDNMYISAYYLRQGERTIASSTNGKFNGLTENRFSEGSGIVLRVAYRDKSTYVDIPLKIEIQESIEADDKALEFVYSPTINVPEDTPLVGGMECKVALPNFPITITEGTEGNKKMLRIGINVEKDLVENKWSTLESQIDGLVKSYGSTKDFNKKLSDVMKNMKKKNMKGYIPGMDNGCTFSCIGYLEAERHGNKISNQKGYLCIAVSGSWKFTQQTVVSMIPIAFTETITADMKVTANAKYDYQKKSLDAKLELASRLGINLKAGVGVCGVAEAGVFGDAGFNFSSYVSTTDCTLERLWLDGKVGVYAYAGPFGIEHSLLSSEWQIYPKEKSKVGSTTASEADIYSNSEYSLLSASELSEESAWNNSKAKTSSSTLDIQPLLKNTYAGSRPKLASTGDTAIMVYTGYEDTSDMLNNGRVLYSVYKNNSWSEPQAVSDRECMQMSGTPVVCGNDIYVVYQQADSVMDGAAVTSPNEMAGHLGIAVAKYNKETGTFENAVTLTDSLPNTYNSLPTMGMYNSVPTAVWVNNKNTDYFGTNTTNQIMMSQFVNGSWTEPKIVADNLNAVTELKLGTVGNTDRIAYLTDSDNDMLTADDRVLYLMDVNGQKNKISSGSQFGLTFANVPGTEGSSLMWSENGSIAYLSNANGKSAVIDTEASVTAFSCVGGRILYTAADEGESSNIYEISYDSKLSAWGNPVRMTNQTDYLRSLDGAEVNGEVIAVLMKTKVNDYVSEDELDTTDTLGWIKLGSIHDIALTYTNFENADIQLGENIPVSMDICNNGNQTVNGIRIVVTDADGKEIYGENKSVSILPGKTLEAVYDIPVPATLNGTDYTLTVTELNDAGQAVEELDKENNTDVLQFGLCDLSVFVMTEPVDYHVQQCTVTVTNEGAVPASAKITGYDGEETALKVSPIETEELAPGESVTYLIDLAGDSFESGELSEGVLFKLEPSVEDYNSSNDENGAAITKQCEVNFVTDDGTDMELFLEGAWVTLPELESGLVWSYDGKAVNEYQVWEDVTFTAVEGYRVSYAGGDADGGEMYDSTAAVSGQSVVLAENAFTRTGYTFVGWSEGLNLYQPGEEYTSENGDVVMTAQWKKVENAGGGSQTSGGETSGGSQTTGGEDGSQSTSGADGSQTTGGQDGSQSTGGQDGSQSTSGADGSQSTTGGQDGSQTTGGVDGSQTTGGQGGSQTNGGQGGSQTTSGQDGSQSTSGQDGSQTNGGQGGSQISGGTNADGSPSIGGADGSQSSGGQDGSQSTGGQGGSQSTSGADGSQPSAAITDPNLINNASSATANVGKVFTRSKLKYKVVDATSVELVGGLNKKITKLVIPTSVIYKGVTYKVTSIRKNAFSGYKKLATVKTGNSVKVIGSKAFYNCPKLTSISLGKNTTIIGASAFSKCTALKKIVIPSKVSSIGKQAFAGCKKLQSITIKSSKLTKKSIGAKAFSNISKKAVVKVPKKKLKSYKSFLYQKGLQKSVKIGKY